MANLICIGLGELRGMRSERELRNEKTLPTEGCDSTICRAKVGRATHCSSEDMFEKVLKWPFHNLSFISARGKLKRFCFIVYYIEFTAKSLHW